MRNRPSGEILALFAALLLALCLRLVNIGTEPYWGDEVLSLDIARHFESAREMVRYVSQVEFHPPLYYLMLKPWISWFGESEAATRALSLIFSVGIVAMVWALGRKLFPGTKAGLVAAFVMAALPLQVEFGQEARPYAIFCFFSAVAAYAMLEHLKNGKRGWAVAYVAAAAVAMYLHYSAAIGVIALGSWWLLEALRAPAGLRSRAFAEWLSVHAVLFLVYYPWLVPLLYKICLGSFEFFGKFRDLSATLPSVSLEHTLDQLIWMTKSAGLPKVVVMSGVAFKMACLAALCTVLAGKGRKSEDGTGVYPADKAAFFLVWTASVTVLLYLVLPQSDPYSNLTVRHAIFATVPLALLFGWLVSRLPPRGAAAMTALFFVTLVPFVSDVLLDDSMWDYQHRLREAGEQVSSEREPGDIVIVPAAMMRTDFSHYLPADLPVYTVLPIPFFGNDIWSTRETLGLLENESQVRGNVATGAEITAKIGRIMDRAQARRAWLYGFIPGDTGAYRWFEDNGWKLHFRSIGGVYRLDEYVRP